MKIAMTPFMCYVMLSLLICFLLLQPTQAIKQPYIVYLGSHSFGQNPSSVEVESVTNYHNELLGSYLGSVDKAKEAIFYSYNRHINGFAAVLDEEEAAKIAKHPKVLSVFLSRRIQLHTTRSWSFLGLNRNDGANTYDSIWAKSLGEDTIIANMDTGVWPESKSFSDEGMGPVPQRWHGICQTDDEVKDNFHCNRKLIGARYFNKGFIASSGTAPPHNATFYSARDYDGHGSHTLSTAGGNFVAGASAFGNGNGTASGGSPKARVAAYKVCWPPASDEDVGGCDDTDILAAFDAAISDGVDVISVSLGAPEPVEFSEGSISLGSFHAVANGITVVCSASNSGPAPQTVVNVEPWVFTVAASTIDRDFSAYVTLGDKKIFKGESLSEHGLTSTELYPLISAADAKADDAEESDALLCKDGALDPMKANGKILVCLRGDIGKAKKGIEVARVGGVGMILANDDSSDEIIADTHVLPASHVNFTDGNYIFDYINRTKSPVGYISRVKTELGIQPSPVVATFSSRGPNGLEPSMLKPDIIAPGVTIIAAYSEAASPSDIPEDKRRTPFNSLTGTSMSCPHVAGVVGLLKSLHPDWSPAAIKSAIMTTATIYDNTGKPILNSNMTEEATPFDYGAGHVQPNLAADPGLVYDLNTIDYLNFLCGRGYNSSTIELFYGKSYTCPKSFSIEYFNYPSITIVQFDNGRSQRVTRTLTNVGSPGTYKVQIKAPPEVQISVDPEILIFNGKGERKEFSVSITVGPQTKTEYLFGSLDWTDDKHHVRSPIVIKNPF